MRGFTVVELTIAVVVASIMAGIILMVLTVFYGSFLTNETQARITVDSQIILRNMVDELRTASAIRTTNLVTDANNPGGWSTDEDSAILIVATPAEDTSGEYIFNGDTGDYYQNEIIYFAEDNTLYKRQLADTSAPDNTGATNCPEDQASATCPADRIVSGDFSDLSFTFYDQDDALTEDPNLARSVAISIYLEKKIYGQTVSTNNNIRMTLRN